MKNMPTLSFVSGAHVFPCCFSPLAWGITAQLKFTVFYGPIGMKERRGAPLLGLAKSIYYLYLAQEK